MEISIIVLGDIGKSPRIINQAISLNKHYNNNAKINIIGYIESDYDNDLKKDNTNIINIDILNIKYLKRLPNIIYFIIRIIMQFILLIIYFFIILKEQTIIMIQNPPSIPTLQVFYLYKLFFKKSKIIVDCHNYGYTLLPSKNILFKKTYKFLEFYFINKCSNYILTVSNAMKEDMINNYNINNSKIITVYDKCNITKFKIKSDIILKEILLNEPSLTNYFTSNNINYVMATSWTVDDNFDNLINIFYNLNEFLKLNYIRCNFFLTGSGPMKNKYKKDFEKLRFSNVNIIIKYFKNEDYPKIISLCDYGISLHYSTSGVDLPMKVIDYFGAGIPVLAYDYNCMYECVKDYHTGLLFKDNNFLDKIKESINIKLDNKELYNKLVNNILMFRKKNWEQEWKEKVVNIL